MLRKLRHILGVSIVSAALNFNMFIEPVGGFVLSLLLHFASSIIVWFVIRWIGKRWINHEAALDWVGSSVAFLLSIYGYGAYYFPNWLANGNLRAANDPLWVSNSIGYFKILFVVMLIVIPALIYWIATQKQGNVFLGRMLLVLVFIAPVNRVRSYYVSYKKFVPIEEVPVLTHKAGTNVTRPDIFYFIMDGYVGNSALRQFWRFDNGQFKKQLTSLGFEVADSARGNIPATIGAMSLVFNLSDYRNPEIYNKNMGLLVKKNIRENTLFKILKANGYEVNVNSLFFDDKPYFFAQGDVDPHTSLFTNVLTRNLMFRVGVKLYNKLIGRDYTDLQWMLDYDQRLHTAINHQVQHIPNVPVFYYNHLMITHPIYRYNASGQVLESNDALMGKGKYLDQVRYNNQVCLEYFTSIISQYQQAGKPLVIIAHADHGSRESQNAEEDSQIQLFYYDSQHKLPPIKQDEDAVNMMRQLLNTYFGYNLPRQPYQFHPLYLH